MAIKDVRNYYNEMTAQFLDLEQEIKDFENECMNGLIEPERLEEIKENIKPLQENFQRISYIMYLLNKPAKKSKAIAYENLNKKLLRFIKAENTLESIKVENDKILEKNKKIIKGENNE